ncbi:hypothetical protein KIL84_011042 [Mauremys mutica]|uniref:Uncharacterized protein n=1 Tax=Mauremys mutica TaxID=74926 RepID=A0A9D3XDT2_9SAUR|nr:hypothetical protein KIL84_011042 [Mauremys mutica]
MDPGLFLVAPFLQPGYSDHSCVSQGHEVILPCPGVAGDWGLSESMSKSGSWA